MSIVKPAVIFYGTYGTNRTMAEIAAAAARGEGAEVRLLKVPETAPESVVNATDAWRAQAEQTSHLPAPTSADMEWANAYLFSAPRGTACRRADCVGSSTPSGRSGCRQAIVAPGYTDPGLYKAGGNPYGVSVTADGQPLSEEVEEAISYRARRLLFFAEKLAR